MLRMIERVMLIGVGEPVGDSGERLGILGRGARGAGWFATGAGHSWGEFPMRRGRRELDGRKWVPTDGDGWKTTMWCQDSGTLPQ